MRGNYIKRYYLEDHKLAQRARLEFYRALETDRMIAFVGAMGTEAFGYGGWDKLKARFAESAREALSGIDNPLPNVKAAIATAEREIDGFSRLVSEKALDAITGMSMIEEALARPHLRGALPDDQNDESDRERAWPLDQYDSVQTAMRVRLAQHFRRPETGAYASGALTQEDFDPYDVPAALWRDLGIRRFATPSYDFELERRAMLGDRPRFHVDKAGAVDAFTDVFKELRALRDNREGLANEAFDWDLGSGRIRRVYTDGWAVESDMVNRERIDRMIEFAVGTDDVDAHIMHLHGRACNARSMIVSRRDYDNLYRRNDLNRAPFEFAKKMMMGGNPLLFVGLGMTEQELNHEMEEFISNAPYQRVAPTFLLWNASKLTDANHQKAFRLEKLARFGVLTIFDTDLGLSPSAPDLAVEVRGGADLAKRSAELRDLASVITRLAPSKEPSATGDPGAMLRNPMLRQMHIGESWRSMAGRLTASAGPVTLWGPIGDPKPYRDQDRLKDLVGHLLTVPALTLIGPQGSGKGEVSAGIASMAANACAELGLKSPKHCLLINGGLAFDTDTLLDAVAFFLRDKLSPATPFAWRHRDLPAPPENVPPDRPVISRSTLFRKLEIWKPASADEGCLIVINGLERFCGVDGEPLSAELDELLRMAALGDSPTPRVRFLLLGSARVRKYCNDLKFETKEFSDIFESCTRAGRGPLAGYPDMPTLPGGYLNEVWSLMVERGIQPSQVLRRAIERYDANGSTHVSGDTIELRREVFSLIFDENNLSRVLVDKGAAPASDNETKIARSILRALAFIGAPIEDAVLCRMPGLKSYAAGKVTAILGRLCKASLVMKINGYNAQNTGPDIHRYALHRSLLTELRYRFGIPLNEAKLSTAFNMALYVAQPIDGDIPDNDIHDELGEAIDSLIGSYRHAAENDVAKLTAGQDDKTVTDVAFKVARACGHSDPMTSAADRLMMYAICSREYVQSMRGALAMIRGYYSTTGLLTLDSGDRVSSVERDGILLEHAERLDALIDAYGKTTLAREAMRKIVGDDSKFWNQFGQAEPFYPDELVWMWNERGVVRLAMGDLYEARRSFDQALIVNRTWVEANDTGHNWRRIRLNQLVVELEMGELGRVERYCDEIERVTKKNVRPEVEGANAQGELDESRTGPSHEDVRAMAIINAHRGWCQQLRGDIKTARPLFDDALKTFSDLGELRAQAYFGRLHASLPDEESTAVKRIARLVAAQHVAQSARQMDIVHRIQVTLADTWLFGDRDHPPSHEIRQRANRMLEEALAFAIQADVHRVRLEASMTIARARLQTSDFEGALRYAMDAMMIATRYGLELRKITLRALIAQVMVARGHPVTAERLARTCIKMATRKRYQTAIGQAERVILDIPRVSNSISQSDGSGRREF